jgi:uncharacterized membrane protein YccC
MRAAGGGSLTEPHPSPVRLARSSVAGILRDAARLDRTQSDPVVAARNALGVAVPLAIGALTGDAAGGLAATIGALQTGFADRPGPYRLRMLRMLGTALAACLTSAVAVAASRSDAASVVLLLVLAFVAGLLLAGGPSATQVGVAGVAAALIIGHTVTAASSALHVGLFVLAGGALQALLAIAAWPVRRHRPERVALAGLYRELASAARAQVGTSAGPPASSTLTAVRQTFYGLGHDHGPSVEAYRVLLDEAERVRREIVVLAGLAERLGADRSAGPATAVRSSLTAAAAALEEVADALAQARPVQPAPIEQARQAVRAALEVLTGPADDGAQLTRLAAAGRLRALAGQLRAILESTEAGASEGRTIDRPASSGLRELRDPIAVLRANLTLDSAIMRHALRLSALLAASDLVVRLADVQRGYWVSLTLLVVLRPDFATTLQRSVMRVVGTVVGLLLATALVHWIPGGEWWRVVLIAVLAFGMRLAGPGNIALTATCLSGLVVVLLEINGVPAHTTVQSRAVATLAGGGLALLAAVALPNWERRFIPARLAELVEAYRRYLAVVADLSADRVTLHRARAACRLARSNAQASVDRAASEPVHGQAAVELGRAVLSHTHRFIHAVLSIDAVRLPLREAGGSTALAVFLHDAAERLELARTALSTGEPPATVPSLRPNHQQLAAELLGDPAEVGGIETATTLVDATDRITNSLDTLLAELRRQLAVTSRT